MGAASLISELAMKTLAVSSMTPTGDAQSDAPVSHHQHLANSQVQQDAVPLLPHDITMVHNG